MRIEHHLAWLTNSKRNNYEDRFLLPLGALPERLEAATTEEAEQSIQAKIDTITARGLVFAVLDGVGGAPLGMAAAQHAVDTLRQLYVRPELSPRTGFPSAREVLGLLYEANEHVFAWGPIEDDDAVAAGAGATGRPKGAACVTAAFVSPARNITLLHAGDTAAFVYRRSAGVVEVYAGASDVAGRSVRKYIGLGRTLHIDTFSVSSLGEGDLIALVTDGVYPKGYASRDEIRNVLAEANGNPESAANWLVERSRARGSVDDITALVFCAT
jgi:serine/threonine protein phosphatase PrpC